jgi:hypothetical protein
MVGQTAYADEEQDQDGDTVVAASSYSSPEATIYASAARHGVSGTVMYSIIYCETVGFTKFEGDYVGGRPTSHGWAQLHEGGLLGSFYTMGYTDPYNLYQASDFMAIEIGMGNRRHWHC